MIKKKILLLGGTGAMGKNLVDVLLKNDKWEISVTTRNSENKNNTNINYIIGNARDYSFINEVCKNHYDVIVDFMNYNLDEFEKNYEVLLQATNHYLFLSSSRVYENSQIINENTPRLLDTINDEEFLKTNRYALRKAREEDILVKSGFKNWTIIRPYITYSDRRLQLGVYEKEEWLYRFLNDKPLVIRKDILDHYTTLTHGYDVALTIYNILDRDDTLLKHINVVTNESIKWQDILDLYISIIIEKTGKNPKVYLSNDLKEIEELFEGGYNTKYDRLWDRVFDNKESMKYFPNKNYRKIKDGLTECLSKFIDDWHKEGNSLFTNINIEFEKKMDDICKELEKEK